MPDPFDLISTELGIVQGLQTDYVSGLNAAHQDHSTSTSSTMPNISTPTEIESIPENDHHRSHHRHVPESIDKVERRRKREREAARRSRARKQSRVEELEGRNTILEQDNQSLREQLRWLNVTDLLRDRADLLVKLQAALDASETSGDSSILAALTQGVNIVSEHIANANTRAAETLSASRNRSHLTAMILSMFMSIGDDFSDPGLQAISMQTKDKLCYDLGLSDQQLEKMVTFKGKYMKNFKTSLLENQRTLVLIDELEHNRVSLAHCNNVMKSFREHVLGKILTTTQQAKLVVWLHREHNLLEQLISSTIVSLNLD